VHLGDGRELWGIGGDGREVGYDEEKGKPEPEDLHRARVYGIYIRLLTSTLFSVPFVC
jgi:hypothetical protein